MVSGKQKNAGIIKIGDKCYLKTFVEDKGYVLSDSNGKEVFSVPVGTKIETTYIAGVFYTEAEDGIRLYDADTMKAYDDTVLKKLQYWGDTGNTAFVYGETYTLIINENGKSYKDKKEDSKEKSNYKKLPNGYFVCDVKEGDSKYKYTLDVAGSGKPVKVPYEASFDENIPVYNIDKVYYDYSGKEIVNTDDLKK